MIIETELKHNHIGKLAAYWGITGFFLLLGFAVYRLTPIALQALDSELNWLHWLVFMANLLFMAYFEGYRGFQQAYAPRLAARVRYLSQNSTPLRALFAPFFCMGYFGATRRRMITSWLITTTVIVLVILFRLLPQPWRGIMDAGVVVGLTWGIIVTLLFCQQALSSDYFPYSPEVVES